MTGYVMHYADITLLIITIAAMTGCVTQYASVILL
jgi:hypothetical protein